MREEDEVAMIVPDEATGEARAGSLLYPGSVDADLDLALFRDPPSVYRGAPFWSWNTRLDREQLSRQLRGFRAMGFGGAHIHPRTGLATPYLGDEFMELVKACMEQARADSMLIWLYDEDRWPSGFAGGLVTREPRYRAKHLLFTPTPYNGTVDPPALICGAVAGRNENGVLLARYLVVLRDGYLAAYHRLADNEAPPDEGRIWYAYLEQAVPSPWWNNQTYVDTLDPRATARFIEVTHERYAAAVGADFGGIIPAIFTDEPQFVQKRVPQQADDRRDLFLPWTTDFLATFQAAHGYDLSDALPEIFWELPERRASQARYHYHDHLAERFAGAFADALGGWCQAHGLRLTGHMMEEPTLFSQTRALGEAMRSLRAFQVPGIDMLCDQHEYTTAKQAQSVARQYGRPGVLSELYGVTNWDFDFVGHKAQGDWQAALGVTVRVPHLAWVSMAGEGKRDYPASIGYQSPWHLEYPLVEDHFARLNTVLTRGRPKVRVGVLHPIESYWLCFGPLDHTGVERAERETQFAELTRWLLFGLIDFDFIAESLLPDLCPMDAIAEAHLPVGAMRYEAVLAPGMRTIRSSTLERLERFADGGGAVIFAGEAPTLVDALPSTRAQVLAARCRHPAFSRGRILDVVASFHEVQARQPNGTYAETLLHQIRDDGVRRFIFFCNVDRQHDRPVQLTINGRWRPTLLETMDGTTRPLPARIENDATQIAWSFPAHGSLLLQLDPADASGNPPLPVAEPIWDPAGVLADPVPITLSEPNVLLLDHADYRLNDEPWQPDEEILRIDNSLRTRLHYPLKMDAIAQPWTEEPPTTPHMVSLRFRIQADVAVTAPLLALEDAEAVTILLDSVPIPSRRTGWWVDEAIATVGLPDLVAGTHELLLTLPYGRQTNLEWCYLLGDFGVEVYGRHTRIVEPVRELAFGDWTRQRLPFYAGNVTYHGVVTGQDRRTALRVPSFKAPLLAVDLDGTRAGTIAFAPFRLDLGTVASGPHELAITAYGNRVNAFGPLHNANPHSTWFGPNTWRTEGDDWAHEYQLKPMGILTGPRVEVATSAEMRADLYPLDSAIMGAECGNDDE